MMISSINHRCRSGWNSGRTQGKRQRWVSAEWSGYPQPTRGSGERRELPQLGPGHSADRKWILAILKAAERSFLYLWQNLRGRGQFALASPTPNSGGGLVPSFPLPRDPRPWRKWHVTTCSPTQASTELLTTLKHVITSSAAVNPSNYLLARITRKRGDGEGKDERWLCHRNACSRVEWSARGRFTVRMGADQPSTHFAEITTFESNTPTIFAYTQFSYSHTSGLFTVSIIHNLYSPITR